MRTNAVVIWLALLSAPMGAGAKVPPHRFFLTDSLVETIRSQPDTACYRLTSLRGRRIEVTAALDANPDSAALHVLAPYQHAADSITSPVLGQCAAALTAYRPESPLSNFVADALRRSSQNFGTQADIGLCNIGGLRAPIPQGTVTYGNILETCPFENHVVILSLSGDLLMRLFNQIAAVGGEGISGASLEISADGRLLSAAAGGSPVSPDSTYTIATLDYLAEGNDKLTALKEAVAVQTTQVTVRNLVADYIRALAAQGLSVVAETEGRIIIK